jgi:hypothetical protein
MAGKLKFGLARGFTVTGMILSALTQPLEVTTFSLTLKVPYVLNVWVNGALLVLTWTGVPSAKSHLHSVMVPSVEVELSVKVTGCFSQTGLVVTE